MNKEYREKVLFKEWFKNQLTVSECRFCKSVIFDFDVNDINKDEIVATCRFCGLKRVFSTDILLKFYNYEPNYQRPA